jgi:hypothetical protein
MVEEVSWWVEAVPLLILHWFLTKYNFIACTELYSSSGKK